MTNEKFDQKYGKKGLTIYYLQTWVKKDPKNPGDELYENYEEYIIYLDNKSKRVLEEEQFTFKYYISNCVGRTKYRSITAFEANLEREFSRFCPHYFSEYAFQFTKLGQL